MYSYFTFDGGEVWASDTRSPTLVVSRGPSITRDEEVSERLRRTGRIVRVEARRETGKDVGT